MSTENIIYEKSLARCINTLNAIGCSYYIFTKNGQVLERNLDNLPILEQNKKKSSRKRGKYSMGAEYGEVSKYLRSTMPEQISVGDVLLIPAQSYKPNLLRHRISNFIRNNHLAKSVNTCYNKETNTVEALIVC